MSDNISIHHGYVWMGKEQRTIKQYVVNVNNSLKNYLGFNITHYCNYQLSPKKKGDVIFITHPIKLGIDPNLFIFDKKKDAEYFANILNTFLNIGKDMRSFEINKLLNKE